MKRFTIILIMIFIAAPLAAASFSMGGVNVLINLPSEYKKVVNNESDIGFFNGNCHVLAFASRTSSSPLSDHSAWEKNMNGVIKQIFPDNNCGSLSSRYSGSDTISGVKVQRFISRSDCVTYGRLFRAAVFSGKGNNFLIVLSVIDTSDQSYYNLNNLEEKGERLLHMIELK